MANLSKNFYNKEVPTRNLVTTITGIITLVLAVLVGFGIITPEQQTQLSANIMIIVQAVVGVWGAVTAIILMFKAQDA